DEGGMVGGWRLSGAGGAVVPLGVAAGCGGARADGAEPVALVVSDAVFSVAGDRAPVRALHRACRRHGALLVLDEAHSLGVVGPGGQGAAHAAGLAGEPDLVLTVTLSKALGAQGGAVLAAPEVVRHLVNSARAFIFDTGLAPACAGAALAALRVLAGAPDLAAVARAYTTAIARTALDRGLRPGEPVAAICAGGLGGPAAAVGAAQVCAEHGVRVGCFRPPSVPAGGSCLRITGRADLTADDLARLKVALTAVALTAVAASSAPTERLT